MLADVREGLRVLPNPDTGEAFTEDELRRATAKGSWWWREYDSIDQVLQGVQKGNEFLAQQIRADRAHSSFLRGYHAPLWKKDYLPAFGGSGTVQATGNPGTTWLGSTTLGDPFAVYGRDSGQRRYQVVAAGTADSNGQALLTVIAIDGGDETNLAVGATIDWANAPPGSQPQAVVVTAPFSGGFDAETDADFAARLMADIGHKPGGGNWPHVRALARAASVSVEDAFVYCCAFHAGSELVAVTQKRAGAGPNGRIPSLSVLSAVTAALVPPASPYLPGRPHVVVVPPVPEASNITLRLAQRVNSAAGWTDTEPFPPINGTSAIAITTLTTQLDFRITTGAALQLPLEASSSADVHLMVWDVDTSSFESLAVSLVTDLGSGVYRVQLTTAPAHTLALGDWISPDMARRATLATGITAYFDQLGPGELFTISEDTRSSRAFRSPTPEEEWPARAGQNIITFIGDALGSPVSDGTLAAITISTPTNPSDPVTGPSLLVPGKVAVYPLT